MEAQGGEMCSAYSFTTSALDGVSGQLHAPAALYPPERGPTVPIAQEAGWTPEPVWTQARGNILCLCWRSNPDRPVVHSVARHYTD
jgi:hypothetical protein